jgi:hypothetical protein
MQNNIIRNITILQQYYSTQTVTTCLMVSTQVLSIPYILYLLFFKPIALHHGSWQTVRAPKRVLQEPEGEDGQ